MRKIIFTAFFISSTLLAFQCLAGDPVKIIVGEWAPYMSMEMDSPGIATKIIERAFKTQGMSVEFEFLQWSKSLEAVTSGKAVGAALWRKTSKREKEFFFSDPVIHIKYLVCFRKENPIKGNRFDDFNNITIAVTNSMDYGLDLKKALQKKKFKLKRGSSDTVNITALLKGEVDGIIIEEMRLNKIILPKISGLDADKLSSNPDPIYSIPQHLIFPKNQKGSKNLTRIFNRGLRQK